MKMLGYNGARLATLALICSILLLFSIPSSAVIRGGGSSGVLAFDSSFDSGNGTNYSESPTNTVNFDLEADPAPANVSWSKWYYFKLTGASGKTLTIKADYSNDRNWSTPTEAYGKTNPCYSYDQVNWTYVTPSWSSPIQTSTMPSSGTFTSDTVYIAQYTPYSYANLQSAIGTWAATGKLETNTTLGTSPHSRNIYYLKLGTGTRDVVITGRVHPGETTGSWWLQGLMDFLTDNSTEANTLLGQFTFHVFPMANPDGVAEGRTRSWDDGSEGNRDYDVTGPNASTEEAETYLIHSKIDDIDTAGNLIFGIDCHSDHTEAMMWRDSADMPSGLETQILSNLSTYDTAGLVKSTFTQWDAPDGSYTGGMASEYSIPTVTFEGGFYRSSDLTGHLSATEMKAIGKAELQSVLYGYLAYEASTGAAVEWDMTSTGLDTYDATDGATTTASGVTFTSSGAELSDSADSLYFTATDGHNIAYDQGTIEFRFEGTGTPLNNSRFFQFGTDYMDFALYRNGTDSGVFFRYAGNGSAFDTGSTNLWDGTERLIRVTWDRNASTPYKKLYINGSLVDTIEETMGAMTPTDNTHFNVGCSSGTDRQVMGIMSDLKIWRTVEVP